MQPLFRFLAGSVELTHALLMIAWGIGLPLLVWRRFPRLRRGYIWFSLAFVVISIASQAWLGECVLTTWARSLWQLSGAPAEDVPFIVTFTNRIARIRPSADSAVLIWELAIAAYCVVGLWGWRTASRPSNESRPPEEAAGSAGKC